MVVSRSKITVRYQPPSRYGQSSVVNMAVPMAHILLSANGAPRIMSEVKQTAKWPKGANMLKVMKWVYFSRLKPIVFSFLFLNLICIHL